jgi:hypothetical protein
VELLLKSINIYPYQDKPNSLILKEEIKVWIGLLLLGILDKGLSPVSGADRDGDSEGTTRGAAFYFYSRQAANIGCWRRLVNRPASTQSWHGLCVDLFCAILNAPHVFDQWGLSSPLP